MPTGIFRKLLVTYLIIITLIIALLGLILSQLFKVYFFDEKQNSLLNTGRQVNTLLIKYHRGDMSREELGTAVNIIGATTNSRIIVIDLPDKAPDRSYLQKEFGQKDDQLINSLEQVLKGETIVRRRHFASELNTYVMAVGIPVQTENPAKGAVFLFSPVYEVDKALAGIYKIIWLTAVFSLAIGSGIIYLISRKISRPIIEVSRTAENLARGIKTEDLNPASKDEVGQLVTSFNYMKNRLERTEKMRTELIAGVSHELRTPLTAVRGFIQGILDGVIPAGEQEKYLKLTFRETNRLTRLTNDLLELAKLESGGVTLNKASVDIGLAAREVADSLTTPAGAKNITVTFHKSDDIADQDLILTADGDRIRQIFWNLLTNAINYTEPGGRVDIKISAADRKLTLAITDTGIGIPPAELPFIFEKFHRVDKSRDSSLGGSGLGLAIVKNLVELHGGKINITSQPGSGTTVKIDFPQKI